MKHPRPFARSIPDALRVFPVSESLYFLDLIARAPERFRAIAIAHYAEVRLGFGYPAELACASAVAYMTGYGDGVSLKHEKKPQL